MSDSATIHGEVTYREGDGMPMAIPKGRVEVTLSHDSATLSWDTATDDGPVAGLAAMPREQFDRYLREGQVSWVNAVRQPQPAQDQARAA